MSRVSWKARAVAVSVVATLTAVSSCGSDDNAATAASDSVGSPAAPTDDDEESYERFLELAAQRGARGTMLQPRDQAPQIARNLCDLDTAGMVGRLEWLEAQHSMLDELRLLVAEIASVIDAYCPESRPTLEATIAQHRPEYEVPQ